MAPGPAVEMEVMCVEPQRQPNSCPKSKTALQKSSLNNGAPSASCSAQKQQQIIVPSSTSRAGNFNNATNNKKPIAPIAVVLSKDQRVASKPNLLLSPLIFLSNDKNRTANGAKNLILPKIGSSATNSAKDAQAKDVGSSREERDSSLEAEDSLGTLLSKHFEDKGSEFDLIPASEIAKRRWLHERARVRHVCHICNRECPSKHKLKRHLSTHSEERPFECPACGKAFKWSGYLQKHIRQQHSNCIDVSPTSPLTSPPSQCQVATDMPTFSTHSPSQLKQKHHKRTKKKRCSDCLSSNPNLESSTARDALSDSDSEPVDSLIVSIPTRSALLAKKQSESADAGVDPLSIDFCNIEASPGTLELCSNFSTAVSAIMAEPVPSSCIQSHRPQAQVQSAASKCCAQLKTRNSDHVLRSNQSPLSQGFGGDYESFCYPNQFSQTDYGLDPLSSFSPGLVDQNMATKNAKEDQFGYNSQESSQSSIDPTHNQLPDLIQVPPQYEPLCSDLQLEQELNNLNFGYCDPINTQYPLNNQQLFAGESLLDDLNSPGLAYNSNDPGYSNDFLGASNNYLDIQQARQLLYENSQQMKRILRSYQALQNTLLRVTTGAMLNGNTGFNGMMDGQNLLSKDQMMSPNLMNPLPVDQQISQPNQMTSMVDHVSQAQSHMIGSDLLACPQDSISTIRNHITHSQQNKMLPQNPVFQQMQPQDDRGLMPQNTVDLQQVSPTDVESAAEVFESSPCNPEDLLAPIPPLTCQHVPPQDKQVLENNSVRDAGVQCELGPETIVAMLEESAENQAQDESNTAEMESDPIQMSTSLPQVPPPNPPVTITVPAVQIVPEQNLKSPADQDSDESTKTDRLVNKFRCQAEGCSKAYLHRKDVTRHMKIRHGVYIAPTMLKPVAMEAVEKPYVCPEVNCGRSYHHLRDLRRHQRNCHGENSQTPEVETQKQHKRNDQKWEYNSIFGKIQLRFPCDVPGCIRSYVHKKDLVRHKRLYHKDTSSKPSVPVAIPYSDADLRFVRHDVKQEMENLMSKARLDSCGNSARGSVSSTTDSESLLSPDPMLSTLNNDVFLSLGLVSPNSDGDTSPETAVNTQILSLIQNLASQSKEMPITLPMSVPVIPVMTDGSFTANFTLPGVNKPSGESNCAKLKQVLSEPSKAVESNTITPTSTSDILDISAQNLLNSLKPATEKRSPETLANLAAFALSSQENLGDALIKSASEVIDLEANAKDTLELNSTENDTVHSQAHSNKQVKPELMDTTDQYKEKLANVCSKIDSRELNCRSDASIEQVLAIDGVLDYTMREE